MDPQRLDDIDLQPRAGARSPQDRRAFLRRIGIGGAAAAAGSVLAARSAAAQTSTTSVSTAVSAVPIAAPISTPDTTVPATTTTAPPRQPTPTDLVVYAFAQSLELAMSDVYRAAIAGGKLSEEQAVVAGEFQRHHREHAQSFAGLSGRAALGIANRALAAEFVPRVEAAADEAALLTLLYDLENKATASYTAVLGQVQGVNGAALVGSIQLIESRHALVLGQAAGMPIDEIVPPFETTSDAADPDSYPIEG
jgi:hypothetical protein